MAFPGGGGTRGRAMQEERGSGRPRWEGGRQGRRRPGGADRVEAAADSGGRGGGVRARSGARGGRARGRARARGEPRARGVAPIPRFQRRAEDEDEDDVGDDLESHGEKKEELGSYSRRKIVSNWNRYEDAEKEAQNESGESQRGSDFSVLLSSAGDSFTQFRFAEEKEWDTENICPKQLSALYVDCQSLVQALQELPLHLRLNVAPELVQASTPVELPQMKSKTIEISKSSETRLRQPLAQSGMPICDPISDSVTCSQSRDGLGGTSFLPIQRGSSVPKQEMDHLDEELDLLLNLDAPVNSENSSVSAALSYDVRLSSSVSAALSYDEADLKTNHKAVVPVELDATEERSPASENTSKTVTEEELEDWLDSMIS